LTPRSLEDSFLHHLNEDSPILPWLPLAPLAPVQVSLDEPHSKSGEGGIRQRVGDVQAPGVVTPPASTDEEFAEVEGLHQVVSHSPTMEDGDGAFETSGKAVVRAETRSGAEDDVRLPESLEQWSRASLKKLFTTPDAAYLTLGILLSIALVGGISVIGLLQSKDQVVSPARMIVEDVKLYKTSKDWLINITGIIIYEGSGRNLIKNIKVWVDFGNVRVLVNRVNITYLPYENIFLKESYIHLIILTAKYPHQNHQITINEVDLEIIYDYRKGEITDKIDVTLSKNI